MSYRIADEGFSRGFLTLRAFYFVRRSTGLPEDGLAFSVGIVVLAFLVLPTILFEVCQQIKIWFLFEDFVLVFD